MTTISSPSVAADLAAVAAVPQRIVDAWRAYDAAAFAAAFTEDGTMVLPGLYRKGRGAIQAHMAAAFAGPHSSTQVTGEPVDVRFICPDVAVLVTHGGVLEAGQTELPPEQAVRATWVVSKQDGEWLLAAYHNSPYPGE